MSSHIAFTAPHHAATQAGMAVLEEGGCAVDAMIAAAAMVAVHYPHMNGLGGDCFWLIQRAGESPVAIDACGAAALNLDLPAYQKLGGVPTRGPQAALTMAGAVSGWDLARRYASEKGRRFPLSRLLAPAREAATSGISVTESQLAGTALCMSQMQVGAAFSELFLDANGQPLGIGQTCRNSSLANLFEAMQQRGLADFYQGEIAASLAESLQQCGSALTLADFHQHKARIRAPLVTDTSQGRFYNLDAPTQGLASLLILAMYDRLFQPQWQEAEQIHHLVEATKLAFSVRDSKICDPACSTENLSTLLSAASVNALASRINARHALPWPLSAPPADTIWMGACDADGTMVSFIQSLYWEFGSGVVLPEWGLVWNNRGVSFSVDSGDINVLAPGKIPRHTLNPALAELHDGRRMVYGSMGGDGQPQTQAAIVNRVLYQNQTLEDAIAAPRWLLGRTWGDQSTDLKLEASLAERVGASLRAKGHDVQSLPDHSEAFGHAGAILRQANGECRAASDPRSDGAAQVNDATSV